MSDFCICGHLASEHVDIFCEHLGCDCIEVEYAEMVAKSEAINKAVYEQIEDIQAYDANKYGNMIYELLEAGAEMSSIRINRYTLIDDGCYIIEVTGLRRIGEKDE